jgi:hypothetical protein
MGGRRYIIMEERRQDMIIEKIERREIEFIDNGERYTDSFPGETRYYIKIGEVEIELERKDYDRIEIK